MLKIPYLKFKSLLI